MSTQRTEHIEVHLASYENRVTNAALIVSEDLSFIDGCDGRGVLVRTYNSKTGTQDIARLTPSDIALLREFLFQASTGTYPVR